VNEGSTGNPNNDKIIAHTSPLISWNPSWEALQVRMMEFVDYWIKNLRFKSQVI